MQQDESLRDQLLAEVAAIAPILEEHAAASEKLGHLDDAIIEAVRKTRLLRFVCPHEVGGDEADPLTQLEVLEAIARIDASASWVDSCGLDALRGRFFASAFGTTDFWQRNPAYLWGDTSDG